MDGRGAARKLTGMRRALAVAVFCAVIGVISSGCGGIPSSARTTVLSVQDLESLAGATRLAKAVSSQDGVYRVIFDKGKVEITVLADPGVDVLAVAGELRDPNATYAIVEGAGHGSYKSWEKVVPDADVKVLNENGADIPELESSLAKGKVTIVDFSAKWCAPCRMLDAYVTERLKTRRDLAYRKIDILDWDSPVANHYMSDVRALPFVIVYGKDGKEIDRITGVDQDRLEAAIDAGANRPGSEGEGRSTPDPKPEAPAPSASTDPR